MRDRHHASGLTHDRDDRFGGWTGSRHERRSALSEQSMERIVAAYRGADGDECIGDLRTPDASLLAGCCGKERLDIDRVPESGKSIRDLSQAAEPIAALRREKLTE